MKNKKRTLKMSFASIKSLAKRISFEKMRQIAIEEKTLADKL